MKEFLDLAVLAVTQGITEFLPVSSSGHLAVLGALFGVEESAALSIGIVLHAGSLAAIVVYYFKELWKFVVPGRWRLLGMVLLGSVPAGIGGVTLKVLELDEKLFSQEKMLAIGFSFLITGALLRLTGRAKLTARADGPEAKELDTISVREALIIGFAQLVALLPGISRSGSTIAAGILSGVKREAAATYSFLLALVAIGGASLLEGVKLFKQGGAAAGGCPLPQLAFGFVVSAAVSYVSLAFLMKLIRRGRFVWFSYYLFALGAAVVVWSIASTVK